jgi:hypothetical protein
MNAKKNKGWDWTAILILLLFSVALSAIGIDIVDNPLSWFLLNGLFLWATGHAYRKGIYEGGEIAMEICHKGFDELTERLNAQRH